MNQVICKNCGAKIDPNDVTCPYCHAMQYDASEKKYMKDLYKLNNDMDRLDNDAVSYLRKQAVRYGLITVAAILLAVGIGMYNGYSKHMKNHESKKERNKIVTSFDWYDQHIDTLSRYVEEKEFKKASDLLSDYEGDSDLLKSWDNYGILYIYRNTYTYFDSLMKKMDQSQNLYEYEIEEGVDAGLSFYNLMTDKSNYYHQKYVSAPDKDKAVMEQWLAEVDTFFTETIGVTKEEYSADAKRIYSRGSCDFEVEKQIEQSYYQKYLKHSGTVQ